MPRHKIGSGRKKATGGTRRKTTKRRSTRRRISGTTDFGGIAEKLAGLGVGAVASREIVTLASKMFTMSPTIASMLQIGIGIVVPMAIKSPFGTNMGDGAVAAGVQNLLVNVGVISGVNDKVTYSVRPISHRVGGNFAMVAGSGSRQINGGNFDVVNGAPQTAFRRSGAGTTAVNKSLVY